MTFFLQSPWLRVHWKALIVLPMLTCAVFLPVLGFEFLNWDDPWYVVENETIRSWQPDNLYRLAVEPQVRNYAPLTMFSLLLDRTLWGDWAGGFHLTNVLLHAVNAVLVYALIFQLSGSRVTAWLTAVLFAIHPVQVESVAWISSRKGVLSATFMLASLICWLRTERTARHEWTGTGFLLAALLAKALAVVAPAIVLLYDLLVRREKLAVALPRQIIPGFLCCWLLLTTMSAQVGILGGVRDHMQLSKPHILAVDSIILWKYVGHLVWPSDLNVLYDPPVYGIAWTAALAGLAWLAIAVTIWKQRRSHPLVALAAATFVLLLLPVLNLFPITTLMNDRYLYLPAVPFFAVCGAAFRRLAFGPWSAASAAAERGDRQTAIEHENSQPVENRSSERLWAWRVRLATAGVLALLVGTMAATRAYLPVWRDSLSLWKHANRHTPQLAVVQFQLADALHEIGRNSEAADVLEHVLDRNDVDDADRERIERQLREWRGGPKSVENAALSTVAAV